MRHVQAGEHAVIVGCGYAGQRLARLLESRGATVTAFTRSGRSVAGLPSYALDLDSSALPDLPRHDVLFYLAPPPGEGVSDPRSEALIAALDATQRPARAVVLVSTTGVYGECLGARVDELSPLRPGTDRATRRVAAESFWRAACTRWRRPLAVLRVAGIYGPGRLPVRRLDDGGPIWRAEDAPVSNRIHVEDFVSALHCVVGLDGTLDVADGNPMPLTVFYHLLADATGRPRLPETDDLSQIPQLRGGFGESRRIHAQRLKTLLGGLAFADIVQGLRASVRAEREGA